MVTVKFTVKVTAAALAPPVQVWIGLDINNDNAVNGSEIRPIKGDKGTFVDTFSAAAPVTTGLDYLVFLQAPHGSTYAITAVDGAGKSVAAPPVGKVGTTTHAATTSLLA